MLTVILLSTAIIFFISFVYVFFQKQLQNNYIQLINNDKQTLENENNDLINQNNNLKKENQQLEIKYSKLQGEFETIKSNQQKQEEFFKEQQDKQQKWIEQQQENQKNIFQNISNNALKEQTEIGKQKIDEMLKPFKDEIEKYQKSINEVNTTTTAEIKTKIDEMLKQTLEIGGKADRLANAFEGDKKGQGNFGELKFENLLQMYGFKEGEDYYKQYLVKTDEQKNKYPDFILQAQPNKWLVIDAKFSIVGYEKYVNEKNEEQKPEYLKSYVNNLKNRIKELGEKEYHKLLKQDGKETFDFVCLFFGNEMAYLTAISDINYRQEIEDLSRKYKVAILTSSAFSPILLMIQQLWSIGKTNENINKARDMIEKWLKKVSDFVENMKDVGKKIEEAKKSYNSAVKQLQDGKGNATTIANNIIQLVDAKLQQKNGKEIAITNLELLEEE